MVRTRARTLARFAGGRVRTSVIRRDLVAVAGHGPAPPIADQAPSRAAPAMRPPGTGRRRTLIGALALAAAALGAGVGLAVNAASSDVPAAPPPPPWVRPDGTVDASRMPARIGLVGFDGKPVLDAHGRPVTVPFGAPSPGGSTSAATASDALQRADAAARGVPIPPEPRVTQSR